MIPHTPSGRHHLGLTLACVTTVQWGVQVVLLKILMGSLDIYTIAWARFLTSTLILFPFVLRRQGLRSLLQLRGWPLVLLLICVGASLTNFLTFMAALEYISPGTAQVLMQLAPMFMLLGSMLLFGESFNRLQWMGVIVLIAGLALFFSPRRDEFLGDFESLLGIILILVCALMWAVYLLAQKQLLTALSPEALLFAIYFTGALVFFPASQLGDYAGLNGPHWIILGCSCVITVASFCSYAHAVSHVEASRAGVIFSLSPLVTFLMAWLFSIMMPGAIEPEQLMLVSIAGALMVVAGSALGALGRTRPEETEVTREEAGAVPGPI